MCTHQRGIIKCLFTSLSRQQHGEMKGIFIASVTKEYLKGRKPQSEIHKSFCDLIRHLPSSGWELVFKFWGQYSWPIPCRIWLFAHTQPQVSAQTLNKALLAFQSAGGAVAELPPVAGYYFGEVRVLPFLLFLPVDKYCRVHVQPVN